MKHVVFAAAAGIGLAALLSPAPAEAQHRSTDYGYGHEYQYGGPYGGQVRRERVCQPWCPYDYSPCDPPNFKIADRRCRQGDSTR